MTLSRRPDGRPYTRHLSAEAAGHEGVELVVAARRDVDAGRRVAAHEVGRPGARRDRRRRAPRRPRSPPNRYFRAGMLIMGLDPWEGGTTDRVVVWPRRTIPCMMRGPGGRGRRELFASWAANSPSRCPECPDGGVRAGRRRRGVRHIAPFTLNVQVVVQESGARTSTTAETNKPQRPQRSQRAQRTTIGCLVFLCALCGLFNCPCRN